VSIVCNDCGRVLTMTDNLLHGLPSHLETGGAANLMHYDEISARDENILARRARTRNHRTKMDTVIETLGLRSAEARRVVLEIGAGNGAHGAEIVETGCSYVGLDISTGFLSRATSHYPGLRAAGLLAADATRTPFRGDVFDAVFGVATLHHLPVPERGIQEVLRLLRPNGRFCFIEPKRFYPVQFIQAVCFPETEVSAMKMRVGNVGKWLRAAGARELQVSYCVYTPNGPAFMVPVWNLVDAVCKRVPPLHTLSVMFCLHGRK
jgi:SAM-dependent methyltransferase